MSDQNNTDVAPLVTTSEIGRGYAVLECAGETVGMPYADVMARRNKRIINATHTRRMLEERKKATAELQAKLETIIERRDYWQQKSDVRIADLEQRCTEAETQRNHAEVLERQRDVARRQLKDKDDLLAVHAEKLAVLRARLEVMEVTGGYEVTVDRRGGRFFAERFFVMVNGKAIDVGHSFEADARAVAQNLTAALATRQPEPTAEPVDGEGIATRRLQASSRRAGGASDTSDVEKHREKCDERGI